MSLEHGFEIVNILALSNFIGKFVPWYKGKDSRIAKCVLLGQVVWLCNGHISGRRRLMGVPGRVRCHWAILAKN